MGAHESHHHDDCDEAHIEYAESDAHHGGRPEYKMPHTTKGKQMICVAGYCWSPQFDRVKAIVDALVHEFPAKYEAWFFETNYVHWCIPRRRKLLGDDEVFDRLPLCWIQYDDGTNKIIGGRNRLATWVLATEKHSKAAMEAVFLEISDGIRHAAPSDTLKRSQEGLKEEKKAPTDEKVIKKDDEDEEKKEKDDKKKEAEDPDAMPEIYKKILALITANKTTEVKKPSEDDDDELKDQEEIEKEKKMKKEVNEEKGKTPLTPKRSDADVLKDPNDYVSIEEADLSDLTSDSDSHDDTKKGEDHSDDDDAKEQKEVHHGADHKEKRPKKLADEKEVFLELPRRPSEDDLDKVDVHVDEKLLSKRKERQLKKMEIREMRRRLKMAAKKAPIKTTEEMIRECEARLKKEYPELEEAKKGKKDAHHRDHLDGELKSEPKHAAVPVPVTVTAAVAVSAAHE